MLMDYTEFKGKPGREIYIKMFLNLIQIKTLYTASHNFDSTFGICGMWKECNKSGGTVAKQNFAPISNM